ncbi:MAG: autotransporter outer membrane beta-barrel domain-containing protein [Cognatishimia sp.]|uniref:autotransporter outer membrane beta-barrel domain-containing protein n=1 Tax=Cognatishimia sp. TaxID=2211648 RepID=UPI003B8B136A
MIKTLLPNAQKLLCAGLATSLISIVAAPAHSQAVVSCDSLGTVTIGGFYRGLGEGSKVFDSATVILRGVNVSMNSGDTLNFALAMALEPASTEATAEPPKTTRPGTNVSVFFDGNKGLVEVPGSFTANTDGVAAVGAYSGATTVTCTPAGTASNLIDPQGQPHAIQTALFKNAQSRRGNGGNVATQNSLFFATRNLINGTSYQDTPEFNAWLSLEGRRLDGDTDGSTVDLTFGFDQEIGDGTIVGGFAGFGHQKFTTAGVTSTAKSPAVGAYASFTLGTELFLDAHLGLARPNYEIGVDSFVADRLFGGLSLSGHIDTVKARYTPFLTLQAVQEKRPAYAAVAANTIRSNLGTLGLRVDANQPFSGGLKPYASVAVDFSKSSDSTGAQDDFVSPRIGFGGSYETGAGLLRFDFDLGKVGSNTRDYGANISYELNF